MSFPFEFSVLESRQLLSGTHGGEDPKVSVNLDVDRATIVADISKLKSSVDSARGKIASALANQKAHAAAAAAKLKSLNDAVASDSNSVKSVSASTEVQTNAVKLKWSLVLTKDELDVRLDTPGETEAEHKADLARLTEHRNAMQSELTKLQQKGKATVDALQAKIKSNRSVMDALNKSAAKEAVNDAKSLAGTIQLLDTVYQSGKLLIDGLTGAFKSHGGDASTLPAMPKL